MSGLYTHLYTRPFLRSRVEGIPAPKGSKKLINGRLVEASPRLTWWNHQLEEQLHEDYTASCATEIRPVHIELTFRMPKPKTRKVGIWHEKRPDVDKLARAVLDALTRSGVIADDSQVASLYVCKRYDSDLPDGVDIEGWIL